MIVPFKYLNEEEIKSIGTLLNIYMGVSTIDSSIVDEEELIRAFKIISNRRYLSSSQVIEIASILLLCLTSSEMLDLDFLVNIEDIRYILLKLLTIHKDILSEEDYVYNQTLFSYLASSIKKFNENRLSADEKAYMRKLITLTSG
ncbi:hypothetical protein ACSW8S_17085 (plasmid) [Clostridium perfringens]